MNFLKVALALMVLGGCAFAQKAGAGGDPDATVSVSTVAGTEYVYKTLGGRALHVMVFEPDFTAYAGARPAFVSFHGGGWVKGAYGFKDQSVYLASRGMVAVEVEYRLLDPKGNEPPVICIEDAKSALRWVRAHAAELHVDPHRVAGAGGSAGGHLAAFAGLMQGFDDPGDDLKISARPDAMILFNPALINGPGHWGYERVGERYLELSPFYHVAAGAPPTLLMSGTEDTVIPPDSATEFMHKMKAAGNNSVQWLFPGQVHGFFNKQPYKDITLFETDEFLVQLGWLHGPPTLKPDELPVAERPVNP